MNRTLFEITKTILDFCKEERKITEILYHCRLNWYQNNKYLDFLISKQLLSRQNNKKYITTEKGAEFSRCLE